MAGLQEDFVNELMSEDFFALGKIKIYFMKTTLENGRPADKIIKILEKNTYFSLQGASAEEIMKAGFSDFANNEYFKLFLKEPLPTYNEKGYWFKVAVDGGEYLLRKKIDWRAYNLYYISRKANNLNPY